LSVTILDLLRTSRMAACGRYVKLHIAATMCSSELGEAPGGADRKPLFVLASCEPSGVEASHSFSSFSKVAATAGNRDEA
jgi:hypothetical protein